MASEVKKYVEGEREFIQSMIDLRNFLKPVEERIKGSDYDFFEALVMSQKELGTINTPTAEAYVKNFLGKPEMSRRSFLNYRNDLLDKKWLREVKKDVYAFVDGFDFYKKEITKQGTVIVTIERKQ